jgi:putative ABC transport system ATP-binding protein
LLADQTAGVSGTARPVSVQLTDIGRRFIGPPAVTALQGIDLQVHPGDYLAILGPSGSGKSTLLNILGLIDRPTTGEYWFDGVPTSLLSERDRTSLRGHRIGFVFQDSSLLSDRTAVENVALRLLYLESPTRNRYQAARVALTAVGLSHRANAMSSTLSGGERQRVAIARAMVGEPTLILCDEPTGNLDSSSASGVLDVLGQLHGRGVTVVVITHDPTTAARAHRHVRIVDGRITDSILTDLGTEQL